jgi:hypothetical protein
MRNDYQHLVSAKVTEEIAREIEEAAIDREHRERTPTVEELRARAKAKAKRRKKNKAARKQRRR